MKRFEKSIRPTLSSWATVLLLLVEQTRFGLSFPQQELAFERLSQEHGLSQSTVFAILQDTRGFMWFGTQDGLNRYDGYNFVVYKHSQIDSHSISDNWVWCIYEDKSRTIWIGTQNGLNRFDPTTNQFATFKHDPKDSNSLSDNYIKVIYEDRRGGLWIGTEGGGLNRLDRQTARFTRYQHDLQNPHCLSHNRVTSIYEDNEGLLWIGTLGGGLNCLDSQTGEFTHYQSDPKSFNSISSNHVMCLYGDPVRRGTLWVGTYGGGLNRFDLINKTFFCFQHDPANFNSLGDNRVFDICSDSTGQLWVGTFEGGLNRFDPEKKAFTVFKNDPLQPQGLSADFVRSVCIDQSNNLWIGTHLGGVNKLDLKPKKFLHYRHDPNNAGSFQHDFVNAVHQDPYGTLWIGTNAGLDKLERDGKAFQHVPLHTQGAPSDKVYVAAILREDAGTLWLGTLGEGLLKYQPSTGAVKAFKHDPQNPASISDNRVNTLYESRDGTLWVGTWHGLNAFDRAAETFAIFQPDPQNPNSLSHYDILCLLEDKQGNIWIGTNGGGLNKFDPDSPSEKFNGKSGRFARFVHDPQNLSSLSHNIVTVLFEDANGALWAGTSDGLNRFDPAREQFVHYFETDGLPNNNICGILGDDQGNLWISTWDGLARFNPKLPPGKQFRSYDRADGLQGQSFRERAGFRSLTGEMFFGGTHGLNRFHPQNVADNPHAPRVAITSFKIFGKPADPDAVISASKAIKLSHRENFFSFEFAALDYTNPEKNQYAYKMEGFDQDWIYSGTRRYASYTNLDPGDYVFKVKGSNKDGVWNETGATVKITITPPFWKTWWFRILAGTTIIGLLVLIYHYRVSRLLEMERLRVRIASDLHDDIGATLTKISLHSELIQDSSDANEILDSLHKIGAMSRELVTTMSDIVWSIDARNDTIGNLVDRMREFAMSVLAAKQVEAQFELIGLELQKKVPVDFRQNIYLIFKEAINNIAKHAEASQVEVRIKNTDGQFNMTIRDDGQRWHEDKLTGQGLRNMKMRAERIGGQLGILRDTGVTVSLVVPALR